MNLDRDGPERVRKLLQQVVESGFWRELDRFSVDAIARALPRLDLPRQTRRWLEIWIGEAGERGRAA